MMPSKAQGKLKRHRNFSVIFQLSQSLITHSNHVLSHCFFVLFPSPTNYSSTHCVNTNEFSSMKNDTQIHPEQFGMPVRWVFVFMAQIFGTVHCLVYCIDSNFFIVSVSPKIRFGGMKQTTDDHAEDGWNNIFMIRVHSTVTWPEGLKILSIELQLSHI